MPRKRLGPTEVSYSMSHLGEVYFRERWGNIIRPWSRSVIVAVTLCSSWNKLHFLLLLCRTKVPQAYPSLLPLPSHLSHCHILFLHLLPLLFWGYGIALWTELPPMGVKITDGCLQVSCLFFLLYFSSVIITFAFCFLLSLFSFCLFMVWWTLIWVFSLHAELGFLGFRDYAERGFLNLR